MNLRQAVKLYENELLDGFGQIVFYKKGRSWFSEIFYSVDGDETPVFTKEDQIQIDLIASIDPNFIMVNGEYWNLGNTLGELCEFVKNIYQNRRDNHFVQSSEQSSEQSSDQSSEVERDLNIY